jgi:hypothetical protein
MLNLYVRTHDETMLRPRIRGETLEHVFMYRSWHERGNLYKDTNAHETQYFFMSFMKKLGFDLLRITLMLMIPFHVLHLLRFSKSPS